MKKLLVYVSIVLALASCKSTLFEGLPGETQAQFPEQLQGTYYVKVPSSFFKRVTVKDTLLFEIAAKSYTIRDSSEVNETKLDKAHRLQLINQKQYVIALQDEDYKKYWNLSFIEPTKRGVNIYFIFEDEKNDVLPKYFQRSFVALNNAGDSVFAYKSNDSLLVNFYEKALRKKDALELVRIKK
jgi:hypothetical protein